MIFFFLLIYLNVLLRNRLIYIPQALYLQHVLNCDFQELPWKNNNFINLWKNKLIK